MQTRERDLLDGLTSGHFENGCRFHAHVGPVVVIAAVPSFVLLLFTQGDVSSSHGLSSSQMRSLPLSEE
jgi:hypothetical protein